MTRLSFAWITLAAMSALLFFRTDLHSDLLFLDSVMTDIFKYNGVWSDWKLTPAPAYVPDMLAYAVSYFVFPTLPQRVVFVCTVQALLLAWVCIRFACVVRPSFSINAKILILLLVSAVVLVAANSSMYLFFNSTNNHFAALIFPIFCLAYIFSFFKNKGLLNLFFIFIGVFVGTASTSVFILAFTLPALVLLAGCFVIFRSSRELRRAMIQVAASILTGHLLASTFNALIIHHDALSGRAPMTIDSALSSISIFASATQVTFGTDNIYTLALAIFTVISITWLLVDWLLNLLLSSDTSSVNYSDLWLRIADDNFSYNLSVIFLLIAFPLNVFGSVLSGGFTDLWAYRYFSFPIVLGVLLWVVMLDAKSTFDIRGVKVFIFASFATIAALGVLSMKPLLVQSGRESYSELLKKGISGRGDAVNECLRQEAGKGFPFKAGIADFWNAREVSYKMERSPYILSVTNEGMPFFHMMSLGPLISPKRYDIDSYNFVIMRRSGTSTPFNVTPETMGRLLPPPAKIVRCSNSNSELWLYADLALDETVKKKINFFLMQQGLFHAFTLDARELSGQVGKAQSLSRVANEGVDTAGFLSYGPYIKIPADHYQVTIFYTATQEGNRWDAGRFNDPQKATPLAAGALPSGKREVKFFFEAKEDIPDFEIRTWFGGRGVFTIDKIQLQPATSLPPADRLHP